MRARALLAAAAAVVVGCDDPGFAPISYLESFRVLGVRAEPPEAAAGERVRLEALAFDPAGRAIDFEWHLCTRPSPPGQDEVFSQECLASDEAPFLVPIGRGPIVELAVPAIERWQLERLDDTLVVHLPIRLRARPLAGPERIDAMYHLRQLLPGLPLPPNRNPSLLSVEIVAAGGLPRLPLEEGRPLVMRRGELLRLRASFSDESREPYCTVVLPPFDVTEPQEEACARLEGLLRSFAGSGASLPFPPEEVAVITRRERVRVSWLATAGLLSPNVTAGADARGEPIGSEYVDVDFTADRYLPDPIPPGGVEVHLYAVGRSGRGGVDWAHRTLRVIP